MQWRSLIVQTNRNILWFQILMNKIEFMQLYQYFSQFLGN